MPKHVFKNSCTFSSIFIYIASITTLSNLVLLSGIIVAIIVLLGRKKRVEVPEMARDDENAAILH